MDNDDLERLLGQAFDAQAKSAVGDHAQAPAPRFASAPPTHRRRLLALAPVAAAAVVVAVVALVLAIAQPPSGRRTSDAARRPSATSAVTRHPSASATRASSPTTASSPVRSGVPKAAVAVRMTTLNTDGATYGVGMPVVVYFSKPITDARALQAATRVTVDGKRTDGAWYFERSSAGHGPIEGHLRPQSYWPAHAQIRIDVAAQGLRAGDGLAFGNDVRLHFATGAATVSVVDDASHTMTVTRDGKQLMTAPVSLGARNTPTSRGIKVVMQKGADICMTGPGYHECGVKYTQRLTYGGEYLHSAPWNSANIHSGRDTSNGCTNLLPADAARLYKWARVGDIVRYPDASGAPMSMGAGYGDWNVPWSTWLTGGLAPTR